MLNNLLESVINNEFSGNASSISPKTEAFRMCVLCWACIVHSVIFKNKLYNNNDVRMFTYTELYVFYFTQSVHHLF